MINHDIKVLKNMLLKQHGIYQKINLENIYEIVEKINILMSTKESISIAIDGHSGAGKTTLSSIFNEIYDCNIFHMDDFFLRPEMKTTKRLKEVGGNVDYVRFKKEIIDNLYNKNKFNYQIYDCKLGKLTDFVTVYPKKLNIIEGVYSMHPYLSEIYDLKIFMSINKCEQSKRILKRNGSILHKRFIEEWIPKEDIYFKEMNIKEKSHIILKENES